MTVEESHEQRRRVASLLRPAHWEDMVYVPMFMRELVRDNAKKDGLVGKMWDNYVSDLRAGQYLVLKELHSVLKERSHEVGERERGFEVEAIYLDALFDICESMSCEHGQDAPLGRMLPLGEKEKEMGWRAYHYPADITVYEDILPIHVRGARSADEEAYHPYQPIIFTLQRTENDWDWERYPDVRFDYLSSGDQVLIFNADTTWQQVLAYITERRQHIIRFQQVSPLEVINIRVRLLFNILFQYEVYGYVPSWREMISSP